MLLHLSARSETQPGLQRFLCSHSGELDMLHLSASCLRFAHPAEATCRPEATGCRGTAGGMEGYSGELLEAAWGLQKLFGRALGGVLKTP